MDLASLMNLVSVEENDWIQLLHGSHGQSGRKIKWILKLHHMYVNGQTSSFQPPLMQFFSCIHSHGMPYDSCGIPMILVVFLCKRTIRCVMVMCC